MHLVIFSDWTANTNVNDTTVEYEYTCLDKPAQGARGQVSRFAVRQFRHKKIQEYVNKRKTEIMVFKLDFDTGTLPQDRTLWLSKSRTQPKAPIITVTIVLEWCIFPNKSSIRLAKGKLHSLCLELSEPLEFSGPRNCSLCPSENPAWSV